MGQSKERKLRDPNYGKPIVTNIRLATVEDDLPPSIRELWESIKVFPRSHLIRFNTDEYAIVMNGNVMYNGTSVLSRHDRFRLVQFVDKDTVLSKIPSC